MPIFCRIDTVMYDAVHFERALRVPEVRSRCILRCFTLDFFRICVRDPVDEKYVLLFGKIILTFVAFYRITVYNEYMSKTHV